MELLSQSATAIATSLTADLLQSFQQKLKEKQIMQFVPQSNFNWMKSVEEEIVYGANRPKPSRINADIHDFKVKGPKIRQTMLVKHGKIQKCSPYMISNTPPHSPKTRTSYRLSRQRQTSPQIFQFIESSHQKPQAKMMNLKEYEQYLLDEQLDGMRKDLKRRRIQESRLRAEEEQMKNKAKPKRARFNKRRGFTFDFDGDIIQTKQRGRPYSLISKISGKEQQTPKAPLSTRHKRSQDQTSVNSSGYEPESQYMFKKDIRQISHLPFISLKEDIKLVEGQNIAEGPHVIRQRKESNTFRHYLGQRLQRQQEKRNYKIEIHTPENGDKQDKVINQLPMKQSRTTSNFLQKIKPAVPTLTSRHPSLNFNHVNSTKQDTMSQFYKHNFEKYRYAKEQQKVNQSVNM